MKIIFIYGPHASGKQTIAEEIAKLRDFRVFHNHTLIDGVASVLDGTSSKNELINKFRFDILRKADQEGLDVIATVGRMSSDKFLYFRKLIKHVKKINSEIFFVQLKPSEEAILSRVESASRKGQKVASKEFMKEMFIKHPDCFDKFPDIKHLTIDNSNMIPADAAKKIIKYYKL